MGLSDNNNLENQHRFVEKKKQQGLKRLILWVPPEEVEALKEIAQQPHAIAKRRREIRAEVERELRPKIKAEVEQELRNKSKRALLVQKRAQARKHPVDSNSPPSRVRFKARPPATVRNRMKSAGWLYDPVAAVWHLPDDPAQWLDVLRLLDELEPYKIQRLAADPDNEK